MLYVAHYLSNIPEGAAIYGRFTQPFGADVELDDAWDRLACIIENNAPEPYCEYGESLAGELLDGLDFPNEGCEITFYLYSTED
jgi:hypothetical protein